MNCISSHDIFSYLETLPRTFVLSLYTDQERGQYVAKTILQRLPELARQYVVRLAICGGAFPLSEVESWSMTSSKDSQSECAYSLERMESLNVIDPLLYVYRNASGDLLLHGTSDGQGNDDMMTKVREPSIVKLTNEFHCAIRTSLTSLQSSPWEEIMEQGDQFRHLDMELCKARCLDVVGEGKYNNSNSSSKYPTTVPTFEELEAFTQSRWDSVLYFLAGNEYEYTCIEGGINKIKRYDDPPAAIIYFLEQTGLMHEDLDWKSQEKIKGKLDNKTTEGEQVHDEAVPYVITSKGYEFMLCDVHVQVWQFVGQYLYHLGLQTNGDELRREALMFLFCLSYCRVGAAYPAGVLSKDSRVLMKDFSHFGLLYVCKVGGMTLFYPTRAAVNLVVASLSDVTKRGRSKGGSNCASMSVAASVISVSSTRALESALAAPVPPDNHVAIVVQTNFQVCSYTTSPIHISMLGLFCDVSNFRRLPNIIFYKITRDSVKDAFKLGIKAAQILRFLKMHAHPKLHTGDQPLIPSNVEDQILLWDRERTRVTLDEVFLLQCQSTEEYHALFRYTMNSDAFGWSTGDKNQILVKHHKASVIMEYVGKWRSGFT